MRSRVIAFGIAALVALADRATKLLVENALPRWDSYVVIPGVFNLVHSQNRGAAFGFLAESASEWRAFVLVGLSLVVTGFVFSLLWQATRPASQSGWTLRIALALIIGGALGNLYDRLAQGSVTDFLQVFLGSYEWPSFNLADSAISLGAGLLLLDLLRGRRQPAENGNAAQAH
ncbi:MAG: signal peptidase II [Acidobacteria bacterium]|nr:signal peptidase II [Acidobacteriota bacterium]